jgi:LacI family transcriptional regulator
MKRPTIHDVAARTSLSISTVSLVINNKPNVSEETRKRVLDAIKELQYHPQRSARGLASRASGNLGFILTKDHFSQAEPFYTKIFLGTEFEARDHHFYILLTTVGNEFRMDRTVPRFLLERNVDGVIIAGKVDEKLVGYIKKLGIPVVLVDYTLKRTRCSSVLIDNRLGAREAVLHLIRAGHRDIGFVGGDIEHPSIKERYETYKETMLDQGLTPNAKSVVVDEEDTRMHNGYDGFGKLFNRGARPTAIFAANDAMAVGCMRYAKGVGLKIPEDLAVVGFDDIEMSSNVEPPLSTIRVFKEELGKVAVQTLVNMVKSKSDNVLTVHVPVELVVRSSSTGKNAPRIPAEPAAAAGVPR